MGANAAPVGRSVLELLELQGELVADALVELSKSLLEGRSRYPRLREIEHACGEVTVEIYELAVRGLAAPLTETDVLALAAALDEVVDLAEEAADTLETHRLGAVTEQARAIGEHLARAGEELAGALSDLDRPEARAERRTEVGRLDREGERLAGEGRSRLPGGGPAGWGEVYDLLGRTLTACDHAAAVLAAL